MGRTVVARWQDWSGTGTEHLVLSEQPDRIVAESALLGMANGHAFAARYRIVCDGQWRVTKASVGVIGDDRRIDLARNSIGNWTEGAGASLPHLAGAIDIDISASPFTNTLPIRRLELKAGQSAEIVTAYVHLPDLTLTSDRQRYTCLEPGRRYLYESSDSDFAREIEIDDHGLVVTYPGLFRRLL